MIAAISLWVFPAREPSKAQRSVRQPIPSRIRKKLGLGRSIGGARGPLAPSSKRQTRQQSWGAELTGVLVRDRQTSECEAGAIGLLFHREDEASRRRPKTFLPGEALGASCTGISGGPAPPSTIRRRTWGQSSVSQSGCASRADLSGSSAKNQPPAAKTQCHRSVTPRECGRCRRRVAGIRDCGGGTPRPNLSGSAPQRWGETDLEPACHLSGPPFPGGRRTSGPEFPCLSSSATQV